MARIEREWLRRIPGWAGEQQPVRRRRRPGEEGPPAEEADDDRAGERDAFAEDAEGEPGEDDAGAHAEGQEASAAEEGDADPAGEEVPEELRLDVPDEVERRRREEQERRRRSGLNLGLAPQAFGLEGHYLRNLATRFARMISKVAEDSADLPSEGDEEWDLNELIRRRFTGRLLSQCRMTREKRKVAVVLDTSPSCEQQARLFASIARIAEELGDCELFDAPNFVITARKLDAQWEDLPAAEREWAFKGRVVLAFGDFDGIERICQASRVRGNRIFWFSCEERPSVLEANRETFVKGYRGHYFPATHLAQLMGALRRVR